MLDKEHDAKYRFPRCACELSGIFSDKKLLAVKIIHFLGPLSWSTSVSGGTDARHPVKSSAHERLLPDARFWGLLDLQSAQTHGLFILHFGITAVILQRGRSWTPVSKQSVCF